MKVLVAAVVIVAACIGTASSEPAVQKTESVHAAPLVDSDMPHAVNFLHLKL